jgi:hypothetical protein
MSRHLAVRSFTRETLERGHMSWVVFHASQEQVSRVKLIQQPIASRALISLHKLTQQVVPVCPAIAVR